MANLPTLLAIMFSVSLAASACDSKTKTDKAGAKKSVPAASKGEPVVLTDLGGLKINVSKGTKPSKMGARLMIVSMQESFMVGLATDSDPKTLQEAKAKASKTKGAGEITSEELADGWSVSFETKDGERPVYYMSVRRTIDGKAYFCDTSVGFATLRDGALAACKSLRK